MAKALDHRDSSTGLSCKTFYNRMTKCHYYKRKDNYTRNARLLFEKVLQRVKSTGSTVNCIFADVFEKRAYTGRNAIPLEDREQFKAFCIGCCINISTLFTKVKLNDIMIPYIYKWKIKGLMHSLLIIKNKEYNLSMCFENRQLTEDDIGFLCLNNHFFNKSHKKENDLIVMDVPQNLFYLISYEPKDYTIQRGFLTFNKGNNLRIRGKHCSDCLNTCKPKFHNGLNRLLLTV